MPRPLITTAPDTITMPIDVAPKREELSRVVCLFCGHTAPILPGESDALWELQKIKKLGCPGCGYLMYFSTPDGRVTGDYLPDFD